MSTASHTQPPGRERAILIMLGAVQFTHFVDYMIMMPLGAQLMHAFDITPAQFSHLVAVYSIAAAVSGFAGGFYMDRFDRRTALLFCYAGFALATLACALSPNHHALLVARTLAGAFGGLSGSLVSAMVGDLVPPERRGRAMSVVMAAFPVASVLGVPAGLVLASHFNWHAPFFFVVACAAVNFALGALVLPHLRTAVVGHEPWQQMRAIVTHPIHLRAFALGAALVVAGGCLIPFLAPSLMTNVGLSEHQLPWVYAVGGACTFFTMPLVGRLTDRTDKLRLLAFMSVAAIVVTLLITRLGPSPLWVAAVFMGLFMVTMSSRFTPAMAMITNAVDGRYRGGFMSVNAALQQGASGLANLLAGWFVTSDATGHLIGYPNLGYVAVGFFALTVVFAYRLRAAAPHVSAPRPLAA